MNRLSSVPNRDHAEHQDGKSYDRPPTLTRWIPSQRAYVFRFLKRGAKMYASPITLT